MTNAKVTVKQMIESLSQFPDDAPVEIAIGQYNKVYPIAYVSPIENTMREGMYANIRDGKTVRIEVSLPQLDGRYMITSFRKL